MTPEAALEVALGHTFVDRVKLHEALTHTSWSHEHQGPHNERLEFLGDAILQTCTTVMLFERWPDRREGELSRLRARLVNTETLAEVARGLDLGAHLRLGRGEDATGGRLRTSVLADAVEALLGAVFVDAGFAACVQVVEGWMRPRMEVLAQAPDAWQDARSRLQELTQARWQEVPEYRVIDEGGPAHAPHFAVEARLGARVFGQGEGSSKKEAIRQAAIHALDQWDVS